MAGATTPHLSPRMRGSAAPRPPRQPSTWKAEGVGEKEQVALFSPASTHSARQGKSFSPNGAGSLTVGGGAPSPRQAPATATRTQPTIASPRAGFAAAGY